MKTVAWFAIALLCAGSGVLAQPAATEGRTDSQVLVEWLLDEDRDLRGIPFGDVIQATSGHPVLAYDPGNAAQREVLNHIATAMETLLIQLNAPSHPVHQSGRINEASSHFEETLHVLLDADPELECDFPKTADGSAQRSGYPDLRIAHPKSGVVFYLDPKLYATDSRESSFRTFYFEPKRATSKVGEPAIHLIAGISHNGKAENGAWQFTGWSLVDLSKFRVQLKAEFQAGNRDLYRDELIIAESETKP